LLKGRANDRRESAPDVIVLQLNALSTTLGAIELWRRGLLNQEAILLRNAIETLATAAVLYGDEASYRRYKKGQFDSAKALTTVKKVWPVIGSMLAKADGFFSNEFVRLWGYIDHGPVSTSSPTELILNTCGKCSPRSSSFF
jgi:hypothetical protein